MIVGIPKEKHVREEIKSPDSIKNITRVGCHNRDYFDASNQRKARVKSRQ